MFCKTADTKQSENELMCRVSRYRDSDASSAKFRSNALRKCTLKFYFSVVISFQNDKSNCKQQIQHSRFQAIYCCFEKLVYEFWSPPCWDNDWERKFLFHGWFPAVFKEFLQLNGSKFLFGFTNSQKKMMDKCWENWRRDWTQLHPVKFGQCNRCLLS